MEHSDGHTGVDDDTTRSSRNVNLMRGQSEGDSSGQDHTAQVGPPEYVTARLEELVEPASTVTISSNRDSIDSILSLHTYTRPNSSVFSTSVDNPTDTTDQQESDERDREHTTEQNEPDSKQNNQDDPKEQGQDQEEAQDHDELDKEFQELFELDDQNEPDNHGQGLRHHDEADELNQREDFVQIPHTVQDEPEEVAPESFDTVRDLLENLALLQQSMDDMLIQHVPGHKRTNSAPANFPHYEASGLSISRDQVLVQEFQSIQEVAEEKSVQDAVEDDENESKPSYKDVAVMIDIHYTGKDAAVMTDITYATMKANQDFLSLDFWSCSEAGDERHGSSDDDADSALIPACVFYLILKDLPGYLKNVAARTSQVTCDTRHPTLLEDFAEHVDYDALTEVILMSALCLIYGMVLAAGSAAH